MNLSNLFESKPKTFDVSSVKYKKFIDQQLISKLLSHIQSAYNRLSKLGFSKIMLGISGAKFEFLIAYLLKQALAEKIIVIIFDFDNEALTNHLTQMCRSLSLDAYILQRGRNYRNEASSYNLHTKTSIKHFYRRFLNYHSFIQADIMKAAVVDTFDKSSRLASFRPEGFYGHLMPFYSLYKSELDDLSKILNTPNQFKTGSVYQDLPYPDNLVLTWDKVDPILFLLTEKQLGPEEISQQFNIDLNWIKKLKSHIDKQLFQTTVSQCII